MSMIDDIKRDREAGTQGPWKHGSTVGGWDAVTCEGPTPIAVLALNEPVNATRIARVPDMEAALIAAEELADAVDEWGAKGRTEATAAALNTALGNYRAATGAA